MTNTELIELLRKTRGWVGHNLDCTNVCDECALAARIDAALAGHADSATPVGEWRPSDQRVFLDGVSLRVVLHSDGLWLWSVYWPLSHRTEQGRGATEAEAKQAAIAAAKGMK